MTRRSDRNLCVFQTAFCERKSVPDKCVVSDFPYANVKSTEHAHWAPVHVVLAADVDQSSWQSCKDGGVV